LACASLETEPRESGNQAGLYPLTINGTAELAYYLVKHRDQGIRHVLFDPRPTELSLCVCADIGEVIRRAVDE
jgi:hypothetical protein